MDSTLPFASESSSLEADYTPMYQAWKQTPSPQTRSELLRAVDPVLQKGLRTYGGASQASPTLRTRAKQLALQSFDTYDPARGSLQSHLLSNMRRLQRTGAQETQVISVPEQVALQRKHLNETETELRYELGRDPSSMEIADRSGLSLKRIAYIRQGGPVISSSQAESQTTDGSAPASQIPGTTDPRQQAWEELVYYDLNPTEQAIFDLTLGRHGSPQVSTTEIARRLGVSPGAISQRAAKIQQKLDEGHSQSIL
jgi:DNA-directed RNA polymerase specialized sigma subunit